MFTSIESAHGEVRISSLEVTIAPAGPKGLWGALAKVATPRVADRQLPVADLCGAGGTRSMFDYDHTEASPLGDDVAALLGTRDAC